MSHWYGDFRAAFFAEWVRVGLPDPQRVPQPERDVWRGAALPEVVARRLDGITTAALRPDVVAEVYGFGHLVGRSCAELFGVKARTAGDRADWCGRFNLGISLFDYVCDELATEPRQAIAALPAFAMFTGKLGSAGGHWTGELGSLLSSLAAGLLQELATELGAPTPTRRRTGLWRALDRMFAAELAVATTRPVRGADTATMQSLLRAKSSEPFRVMAEWVARGGTRVPTRRAGHFGRALGDCFWLVDDACDVWEDLDAGRWNYFLAAAAEHDPRLALGRPSPVLEARLLSLWRRHDVARAAARSSVRRFARALHGLGASRASTDRCAGRFVDAMARWSR